MSDTDSLYATGIRPLVDEYIMSQVHDNAYPDYWRGSSAGYCMRYNIMKRLGVPSVPEIEESAERTQRVFEAGHLFHEWYQRITVGAGLSMAQESEIKNDDIRVVGHFDDLILFATTSSDAIRPDTNIKTNEDGTISPIDPSKPASYTTKPRKNVMNVLTTDVKYRIVLYDYKTANSMAFDYVKPKMGDLHRMQLGTYIFMLRQGGLKGIPAESLTGAGMDRRQELERLLPQLTEGRILQIEKDTLRQREYALEYTPELQKEVVGYWRSLEGYWQKYQETGVLPACTCHIPDDGWFARRSKRGKIYNNFFYENEPCSQAWFDAWLETTKADKEAK